MRICIYGLLVFLGGDGSEGAARARESGVARSGDGGVGIDAYEGVAAVGDESAAAGLSRGPASRAHVSCLLTQDSTS